VDFVVSFSSLTFFLCPVASLCLPSSRGLPYTFVAWIGDVKIAVGCFKPACTIHRGWGLLKFNEDPFGCFFGPVSRLGRYNVISFMELR
jgi:hypothetical protein